MRRSIDIQLKRLADDRWTRASMRMFLRAVCIALSVWCVGVGAHLLFGWSLQVQMLLWGVGICVGLGVLLLLRPRMTPYEAARRLDRRFNLNNQLTTALEVDSSDNAEGVAVHLVDQAYRTTGRVRRYVIQHQRRPWNDVIIAVALALVSIGLFLLAGLNSLNLPLTADPLPPLASADDPLEEFPPEPFVPPESAQQDQQGEQSPGAPAGQEESAQQAASQAAALSALADVFRDQSATRPAADALDQGNPAEAAQELRSLADQASQLSEDTRDNLANGLREVAAQIETESPELAERLRQDAAGLQQGDQAAAEAFDDLASMLEDLDSQEQSPQAGADQGQADQGEQSQEGQPQPEQDQTGQGAGAGNNELPGSQREQPQSSERLGVEGVPLELDSEGEGQTPGEGENVDATEGGSGAGSFEQNTPPDSTRVQTGEDPLRIPADLRDVVQEYFSPAD